MAASTTETATNGNGNDYSYAAALKLYSIGEKLDNLQQMEEAIYLVNTYGRDFPSDVKSKLDVYTYKILKSHQHPHQQPTSNIHHYQHEGEDLFVTLKQMQEDIQTIKNKMQQQSNHDIDTITNEQQQPAAEQQGSPAVK